MNSKNFWDIYSASIIGLFIYPIITLIITGNWIYCILLAGLLFVDLITKLIKISLQNTKNSLLLRPNDSNGCDILCQNKTSSTPSGFPSGHMAIVTFFVVFVFITLIMETSPYHQLIYFCISIIYIGLMYYARLTKKCHNNLQLIFGIFLGLFTSLIIGFITKYSILV
jgi:hypothetical protein